MRGESAAGLALIGAALLALLWSNLWEADDYFRLLAMPIALRIGSHGFALPLQAWVNKGLMTLFFLTVALEIRHELTQGQLASWRKAAAPSLAALGGMVAPALIYASLNHADPATRGGWAVPVATDIAFALVALQALGQRVPAGLKLFLTALAIIDDLGAIVVIALFYTIHIDLWAALAACLVWVGLFGLNRIGVRALGVYVAGGIILWACVMRSGVQPTLAGVALAFVLPVQEQPGDIDGSPAHRLEQALGGWVTWLVLPMFGLVNAGLRLERLSLGDLGHPVVLGTVLGLVVGKQLGVFGTTIAAVRIGLARMPAGLTRRELYGGSILCGIGFTMSLFIGDLSFRGTPLHPEVKLAVFLGSLISMVLGLGVLSVVTRRRAAPARGGQ